MTSPRPLPRDIDAMAVRLAELLQRLETWTPVALRSQPELRGWSGLDLAQRHGGAAWSARDMASLFCRCGRLDVELRDAIGAGHARLLSLVSTRHFDAVLDAVAAGSNYCAIAITEPDVGSDVRSIATTATAIDGGYLLDGVKQHISRIHECTHFIVFAAVTRAAVTAPGITAFLIPRDAAGLVTEPMSPAGLASVSWGRICLQQVKAPSASRIGGEGQAMSLFSRHFCYWRTLMAALAIGSAQAAVDQAAAWMKTRQAFGGPIGRFSHLQQALAEWTARLRMVWLLVEDVAAQIDSRRWPTVDAAMLKAEAMETALAATAWSTTVLGGAGYALEAGLEKRHRDLAGLRIADGATDVLRGQVARAVLGERLYELSLNRSAHVGHLPDTSRRQFW